MAKREYNCKHMHEEMKRTCRYSNICNLSSNNRKNIIRDMQLKGFVVN